MIKNKQKFWVTEKLKQIKIILLLKYILPALIYKSIILITTVDTLFKYNFTTTFGKAVTIKHNKKYY